MSESGPNLNACLSPESCIEKGHCAVHGVEIERRKQTGQRLEELKSYVHECEAEQTEIIRKVERQHDERLKSIERKLDTDGVFGIAMQKSAAFRLAAWIAAAILGCVFLGGFLYTHNHKVESDRRFELRSQEVNKKFELQKIELLKRFELLASEMHSDNAKFESILKADSIRLNNLEINDRVNSERYGNIMQNISRVEGMLIELMKAAGNGNGNGNGNGSPNVPYVRGEHDFQ